MLESYDELHEELERANSKSVEPRQFIFNGNTYIHIPGTETFTIPNAPKDDEGKPTITFTPLQIMSANFAATKSYRKRITPTNSAETMLWLGDSARFKIIRAVQLHDSKPPITPATDEYTPFFQFLSEGVEDHWTVQQQYSSCKWAAAKDEALATSLLLHYGWVPRYTERMHGNCIYQMRRADDGIHLTFSEPHTYQQRLDAACQRAYMIYVAYEANNVHAPFPILFKEACRVFFSYNHYYISITSDFRQTALNKIQAYCQHLINKLDPNKDIPYPELEEPLPDTCIEVKYVDDAPVEYILKWEDFVIENNTTIKQTEQRVRNNLNSHIKKLLESWDKLGGGKCYSRTELLTVMSPKAISVAKEKGTIVIDHRENRQVYFRLDYDVINSERS